MDHQITKGTLVEFDSEHGTQTGTVIDVQRHIGSAQAYAIVEIKHAMPGIVWQVPLNELQVKVAA